MNVNRLLMNTESHPTDGRLDVGEATTDTSTSIMWPAPTFYKESIFHAKSESSTTTEVPENRQASTSREEALHETMHRMARWNSSERTYRSSSEEADPTVRVPSKDRSSRGTTEDLGTGIGELSTSLRGYCGCGCGGGMS